MCLCVRYVRLQAPTRQPASMIVDMTEEPTPADGRQFGSENWHSDTSSASRAWCRLIWPHVAANDWYVFKMYWTMASCSHAPSIADKPPRMGFHATCAMPESVRSLNAAAAAAASVDGVVGALPPPPPLPADALVGDDGGEPASEPAVRPMSGVSPDAGLCSRTDLAAKCECSEGGAAADDNASDTLTRHWPKQEQNHHHHQQQQQQQR
jgi:hypothetical protein